MNAQQIAALGEITKQAIADAVAPLVQRVEQVEKQSQFLAEHYQQETAKILQHVAYDDTELRKQLEALANSVPAAYDDEALRAELKSLRDGWDGITKSIPAPYDDSAMKSAFSEHSKRVAAVIDGVQAIKDRVEEVAKSVPPAYDDSSLRKSMTEQIEAVEGRLKTALPAAPRDGTDGRDALQLEILPAIDEAKSYTRGTYAKHAGGLWRSFEQTSGMRGWECIVNGVKSVDTQWKGKTLIETTTLSDGTTHETRKSFAVQEYKGVFAHGEHEQGDTVTWAGSLWHCNKTGTKAKPGDGSADWTLAVKKGRDGREVVKTERVQGPVQINSRENNDSI